MFYAKNITNFFTTQYPFNGLAQGQMDFDEHRTGRGCNYSSPPPKPLLFWGLERNGYLKP